MYVSKELIPTLRAKNDKSRVRYMRRYGFSTMEMIIVTALIAVVLAASVPFIANFRTSQTLRTVSQDIFRTLVVARHRAQTTERGRAWSVKMLPSSYVLYAGNSYDEVGRDTSLDETQTVSGVFQFGGSLSDIHFQKSTGRPEARGTITITHTAGGMKTITVNDVGGLKVE